MPDAPDNASGNRESGLAVHTHGRHHDHRSNLHSHGITASECAKALKTGLTAQLICIKGGKSNGFSPILGPLSAPYEVPSKHIVETGGFGRFGNSLLGKMSRNTVRFQENSVYGHSATAVRFQGESMSRFGRMRTSSSCRLWHMQFAVNLLTNIHIRSTPRVSNCRWFLIGWDIPLSPAASHRMVNSGTIQVPGVGYTVRTITTADQSVSGTARICPTTAKY